MAEEEKIKEIQKKVDKIWLEINTLLSEKKRLGYENNQNLQIKKIQNALSEKTRELRKLNASRTELDHSYSVILVGDYIEYDGGVLKDYPLNAELNSAVDCKLGELNHLSEEDDCHHQLKEQIHRQYASSFAGEKYRIAYIIQLR